MNKIKYNNKTKKIVIEMNIEDYATLRGFESIDEMKYTFGFRKIKDAIEMDFNNFNNSLTNNKADWI